MDVKNGDTVLEFDGTRIGQGTSNGTGRPRWHEVEIYRCDDGKYVVVKIGRSLLPGEVDRSTAHICDNAHAAVRALYSRDRFGIWKLTITAEDAADAACESDERFAEAWSRQRITA